ncbi:MAG: DUF3140 domain-containing protein, partial [Cytophagales bacterium]|nr:DUF3140 domain-containing protein [Armatimonadota bacterium]
HDSGEESVGHQSGRKILESLRTKKADLTDQDYERLQEELGP